MKKFLFALALLLISSPAFAFICETSQALDAGDACYTQVRVNPTETNVVSAGSVLCYDFTQDTVAKAASNVVLCTVSADTHLVVGTAKNLIASGDVGLVQTWGRGTITIVGAVTSGDALFPSTSEGKASVSGGFGPSGDAIAVALETSTTADASIDALILQ